MNLLTKRIIFLFLIVLGLIFFVIDDDLSYMEIIGFCIIGLSAGVFCLITIKDLNNQGESESE